jgi:flagellar biosynthesis/type III secretory pathway protein FliH
VKALKKARKLIETRSETPEAAILSALVVALESEKPFPLTELYQLDYDDFELALEVLQEWRLDRYYMSKVRLLDLSVHLDEINREERKTPTLAPAKA